MWAAFIKTNKYFFIPFSIFLLFGGFVLLNIQKGDVYLYINKTHTQWQDIVFPYITWLGDGKINILFIVLFLFYRYAYSLFFFTTAILTGIISNLLKKIIFNDMLRPKAYFEKIINSLHFIDGVDVHSYHSFPSGHTLTAFSVFCLLAILSKNKKLGLLYFLLAFFAGYSRIYLSQHFFIDVYFGSTIGVISSITVYYLFNFKFDIRQKRFWNSSLLKRSI